MPPVMKTGLIDVFAFIGTNAAASAMIKDHPSPNRLRVCLGLDAKNPSFVLPSADLDLTVRGIVFSAAGTAGQRCTTLRRLIVHSSVADELVGRIQKKIGSTAEEASWFVFMQDAVWLQGQFGQAVGDR